ncbi:hypothetical protein AYO44_04785 [Planctomycetaceae bacterium SCGC AG-212-F19]|nr:hypothetical protein AYO44_04785 [Planctomycetaceae bacterium SCGC AG-212-F19]
MPIHDWTRVNAGIFHHFHHEWISTLSRALNAGRPPAEDYALAEQIGGGLGPDVLTLEHAKAGTSRGEGNGPAPGTSAVNGGIALAAAPPRVRFTASAEAEQYARKQKSVVIRHASGDHVVGMIEIVSPGNKANRHGLRSFVDKVVELLDAGIHLLVVDPFPPGSRDPQGIHAAIWSELADDKFQLPADKPLTLAAYLAGETRRAFIEPVAVGDALPDMPLFLTPEGYVPVPLDATYQRAWEAVPQRWRDEIQPPG